MFYWCYTNKFDHLLHSDGYWRHSSLICSLILYLAPLLGLFLIYSKEYQVYRFIVTFKLIIIVTDYWLEVGLVAWKPYPGRPWYQSFIRVGRARKWKQIVCLLDINFRLTMTLVQSLIAVVECIIARTLLHLVMLKCRFWYYCLDVVWRSVVTKLLCHPLLVVFSTRETGVVRRSILLSCEVLDLSFKSIS